MAQMFPRLSAPIIRPFCMRTSDSELGLSRADCQYRLCVRSSSVFHVRSTIRNYVAAEDARTPPLKP